MTDREKIVEIIESNKICVLAMDCADCPYRDKLNKTYSCGSYKLADTLLAANIGDVTEWKERAERMHKEALKQKQLISDAKHSEDTLRNQIKCALDMAAGMECAKRTLEILYASGVITEEALRDAVKQAKLEIEEENDDDR